MTASETTDRDEDRNERKNQDGEMTALVPFRVLEGEQVPVALVDLLARTPVVLLGYHVIPDQTAPEHALAPVLVVRRLPAVATKGANAGG
jgi:hypothetical protein